MEENIQGGGVEDKDKDGNYLHIVPSSINSLVEENEGSGVYDKV